MKLICDVCNEKFIVTLKKNIKREDVLIFLTTEYRTKRKFSFCGSDEEERDIVQKAIKISSLCPNCGKEHELFCIPLQEIITGKWKDAFLYM